MLNAIELCKIVAGIRCPSTVSSQQWQQLVLVLREAKMMASLYHRLKRNNSLQYVPSQIQRHLYSASVYAERQAAQVRYECAKLVDLAQQNNCHVYFLKGASYVLTGSFNGFGRIFNDIDVLVNKNKLNILEDALVQNGWRKEEIDEYDEKYYRQWAHEIPPLYHPYRGTVLDIHHNLYLPVSGRAPQIDLFTQGAVAVDSGEVLSAHGIVLHSIIHLFMNEDFDSAYRDLYDVYCLIEAQNNSPEFWNNLHTLAVQSGFEFELMCCAHALFVYYEVSLPTDILSKLRATLTSWGKRKLCEDIFINAIVPRHPSVQYTKQKFSRNIVYLRGHYIKMPIHILFTHFIVKTWRTLFSHLLGNESAKVN